jgi:hypothetical protein
MTAFFPGLKLPFHYDVAHETNDLFISQLKNRKPLIENDSWFCVCFMELILIFHCYF